MARVVKGREYMFWKHPTAKSKYVKAKILKGGQVRIVGAVPPSKVPKKRRGGN